VSQRTLSARELNRALLARQLLLERSTLPLTRALEQVAGLQTQYAPSAYIGLWARLRDFRREELTEALEARRAVQATLMRSTIHVVSAEDFWLLVAGIRDERRAWIGRVQAAQLEGMDMDAVARRVRALLAERPRRHTEMLELLATDGYPRAAWGAAGHWIDLVRVPPSGTWERRRADLYGLADEWLGPTDVSAADGMEHLVRRYLGGFGPAPLTDAANWAGLPVAALRPAVDRLQLRRFRDEQGGELLDLPGAPLPDPDTPAPVRFLPTWDATLLVHARRSLILPERYRPRVFNTRTPHSVPTFLVDGAVAGTWRHDQGRIRLEPFERLAPVVRRELDDEAERLAAFHAD
jgi:hypothetical protein